MTKFKKSLMFWFLFNELVCLHMRLNKIEEEMEMRTVDVPTTERF